MYVLDRNYPYDIQNCKETQLEVWQCGWTSTFVPLCMILTNADDRQLERSCSASCVKSMNSVRVILKTFKTDFLQEQKLMVWYCICHLMQLAKDKKWMVLTTEINQSIRTHQFLRCAGNNVGKGLRPDNYTTLYIGISKLFIHGETCEIKQVCALQ